MAILLADDKNVNGVVPPDDGGEGDDNRSGPGRWLVVATFWTSPEVHLARLKLESEDIPCQIQNENIIAVDFLLAPAVGGIKILVPEFEAERARLLLTRPPAASPDQPPTAFNACPQCGSTHIDRALMQAKTFWAAIVALMLLGSVVLAPLALAGFIYYVIMWRPWHCRDCGNVFRREDGPQGFAIEKSIKPVSAVEE